MEPRRAEDDIDRFVHELLSTGCMLCDLAAELIEQARRADG